jgi:hypothetical protein
MHEIILLVSSNRGNVIVIMGSAVMNHSSRFLRIVVMVM